MTTRFFQAVGTLAVALAVLAGCDSATTDAPDAAGPSVASASGAFGLHRTSPTSALIQLAWTAPAGSYSTTITRAADFGPITVTTALPTGGIGASSYSDPTYAYYTGTGVTLTYTITVRNSSYQILGTDSITQTAYVP